MQRRRFLATLAAAGLMPVPLLSGTNRAAGVTYLSVRADRQRRYYVSGLDAEGRLRFDLPLPARAHAIAMHPSGETAMVVARRPDTFLQPVDLRAGRLLPGLDCDPERHLYGHGVYSLDGRYLYTTENDFEAGRGVIGVREVDAGYRQINEFDSGGIGPHELCLLSDGRTLAVANGGMRTHPDFDRTVLNLETMQPSLCYVDRQDGRLIESCRLSDRLHQNSIRHMAVAGRDSICLAMQYQGPRTDRPPLIALHQRGQALLLLSAPDDVLARMQNYCGSVTVDSSGRCFAVSSPRGDVVTFWSAEDGRFLGHTSVADGCGIAAAESAGEFLLSSGEGGLYRYDISSDSLTPLADYADWRWDNHLTRLG